MEIKKVVAVVHTVYKTCFSEKWIAPGVVMYIESYFEQNPQVKRTRRLEKKLEREYYRSLRKENKEQNL